MKHAGVHSVADARDLAAKTEVSAKVRKAEKFENLKRNQRRITRPKRGNTMKSKMLSRTYLLLAFVAFGCAGAQVTQSS